MHLERYGEIEDRLTDNDNKGGVIRHYTFNTLADIMKYWTELEYISLARIVIEDEEARVATVTHSVQRMRTHPQTNCLSGRRS